MAERTLTRRELNRALLARQLLLERVRLPIPRALERIGGIQDQYAPNAYIRLWSCLEGFRRDDLTRALERRTAVQATLMRATIHVVSKRDFWPLAVAIRRPQREWWLRVQKPRPQERELERKAAELDALLAEGPRRHERARRGARVSLGSSGRGSSSSASRPRARGRSGGRTSSRRLSAGSVRRTSDPDEALDRLVRRYLAGVRAGVAHGHRQVGVA